MASPDEKANTKPTPTLQFASICDHLGVDVEASHDQILQTFRSYYTYLKAYTDILKKKSTSFKIESISSTKLTLDSPTTKVWKVIPRTVIVIDDSNYGWYFCPDLDEELEEGDSINISPGKKGSRKLDSTNFRIKNHQCQFRFPEFSDLDSIIVYGDVFGIEPVLSLGELPIITITAEKQDERHSPSQAITQFNHN